MALVAAKCTQCGASLDVDTQKDAAICPFCHTPFITEKAITNYNTTNVTNIETLKADVVNVESSESITNLIRTADTLMKFNEWEKAEEVFTKITQLYPYDSRGWYGLLQTKTQNFQSCPAGYEYFSSLVDIYMRLEAITGKDSDALPPVRRYLDGFYESNLKLIEDRYQREMVSRQSRLKETKEKISSELPSELKDQKTITSKISKIIWWISTGIGIFLILLEAFGFLEVYNLEVNVLEFRGQFYFWDKMLFVIVHLLFLGLGVSLIICVIGIVELIVQRLDKYKKKTALKFISTHTGTVTGLYLLYWLVAISVVGWNDPGYFFSYGGHYRTVHSILFNTTKATEAGACWIAVLLILLYSAVNYLLMTVPLFITESIGNKKKKVMMDAIEKNNALRNEKERLTAFLIAEPIRHQQDIDRWATLRAKYQNK